MKGAQLELQGQGKLGQLGRTWKGIVKDFDLISVGILLLVGTVGQTVAAPRLAVLSTVVCAESCES